MMGRPDDVDGQCNAHLYIADDYGDNEATMRCGRQPRHEGWHRECYGEEDERVTVAWEKDERKDHRK